MSSPSPTAVKSVRIQQGLSDWLEEAQWSLRLKRNDIMARGIELYLALEASADRPANYELSSDVADLIARFHPDVPTGPLEDDE